MRMSASIEGRTDATWLGRDGFDATLETQVTLLSTAGHRTTVPLDAAEFVSQIAKLVPPGTILRLTVETVDPLE